MLSEKIKLPVAIFEKRLFISSKCFSHDNFISSDSHMQCTNIEHWNENEKKLEVIALFASIPWRSLQNHLLNVRNLWILVLFCMLLWIMAHEQQECQSYFFFHHFKAFSSCAQWKCCLENMQTIRFVNFLRWQSGIKERWANGISSFWFHWTDRNQAPWTPKSLYFLSSVSLFTSIIFTFSQATYLINYLLFVLAEAIIASLMVGQAAACDEEGNGIYNTA